MSDLNVDEIRNAAGSGAPAFPSGINIDPTALSDADATKLGLKQYIGAKSGQDVDISVSADDADFGVDRAVFIPYQMNDGTWRLRFQIDGGWSPVAAPSLNSFTLTISGTVFKNTSGYHCLICNRVHDHENPFVSVFSTKTEIQIRFWCRRNPSCSLDLTS